MCMDDDVKSSVCVDDYVKNSVSRLQCVWMMMLGFSVCG